MKSRTLMLVITSTFFTTMALPVPLAAQHTRYKLIDIGTFGGPQSFSFFGQARSLNNGGTLVGFADTSTPDPNYPNSNPLVGADPFIEHGFSWRKGTLTGPRCIAWHQQQQCVMGKRSGSARRSLNHWQCGSAPGLPRSQRSSVG